MSAMVRLDPEEYVNIRKVEFRAAQRSHPFSGQLRLVDADPKLRDDSGKATLFGYILEDGAPPTCSRFDEDQTPEAVTSRLPASDRAKGRASGEYDDDWVEPLVTVKAAAIIPPSADSLSSLFSRTNSAPAGPSRGPSRETPAASLASEAATRRAAQAGFSGSSRSHSVGSDFALPSNRPAPRLSSHVPLRTPLDDPGDPNATAVIIPSFEPSEAIIFPAGSYDVVLVLDTREVESKTNRDKIADALDAKGVKVETRALRLGDMCWIARRRDGIGGEEDECVLDYVVERKRLDDLCSSIKDGRYLEQCVSHLDRDGWRLNGDAQFRLSNSCINHVFYIVEDWQVGKHIEYSAAQIMTAKSQIQVHNRFFLKETHQLSETIDFLATMSDVITSSHRGKDLSIVPTRFLSRSTYSALQTHLRKEVPAENFLTSFSAYQELNDKSASKTLREKFAGMLLCVKGMSAERVSAVLDVWDTPRGLWDALKERPGKPEAFHEKTHTRVREPEMLFADRVQGDGRRKIGDALSREVSVLSLYSTLALMAMQLYRTFSGGELVS
jgi:crossover junction endonuclease MUS81